VKRPIRTLVVDDNAPFRESIKFYLQSQPEIELVGLLGKGSECIEFVKKHEVDVVLMDARMPGLEGPEATRQLKSGHSNIRVVLCTIWDDADLRHYAKRAGADEYFVKGEPLASLIRKIHRLFKTK
jgi:DNA-binding NarL/FixJ family response regulator